MNEERITPTECAVRIWGANEGFSQSAGARRVRKIARELYPEQAPGKGGEWSLTLEQCAAIQAEAAHTR